MTRTNLRGALIIAVACLAALAAVATPTAVSAAAPSASSAAGSPSEAEILTKAAPAADPRVVQLATAAMACAQSEGVGVGATRLAVIDYSRSSLSPRLWVFDLAAQRLLYEDVVAHGQGSGGDVPDRFSNDEGTHASSLGLFLTADTYTGHNGYSLRMLGLEPGVNDAALERAIVMHGAAYVDPQAGRRQGRLGRSWGCPALRSAVAKPIIDVLKDGQFVFSYYPDQDWLARSALLKCPAARVAQKLAGRSGTS